MTAPPWFIGITLDIRANLHAHRTMPNRLNTLLTSPDAHPRKARQLLHILGATLFIVSTLAASAIAAEIPIGPGTLHITQRGEISRLTINPGHHITPQSPLPFAILQNESRRVLPEAATVTSDTLQIRFVDQSSAAFHLEPHADFTIVRLTDLDLKSSPTALHLRVPAWRGAEMLSTLNTATTNGLRLGLMAASPEVIIPGSSNVRSIDLPGCAHEFTQTTSSRHGNHAARFTATSTIATNGWSMRGANIQTTVPLPQIAGLSAWVHGDGKGQALKFQLIDNDSGPRDYYLPIDFVGWKQVRLTTAALDMPRGDRLRELNIYYNGIPPNTSVETLIDDIRILTDADPAGMTHGIALESFEDGGAPWWHESNLLQLGWDFRYTGLGDAAAIVVTSDDRFFETIQDFQNAANILVPRPDGQWNKTHPAVRENYLFLTSFSESQFDQALELARRGGFKRVLLLQNSWCKSTGHYEVNTRNFPGGLPALVRTVERFREHDIEVGFHLLGASIDYNDPYITPVPDPRLVKDAETTLTQPMDASTTTIIVDAMPVGFPDEDGGYNGHGTVIQINNELIKYESRTTTAPYTFFNCRRGHLGTHPASHQPGATVYHLARSFNYHLHDLDTTLLDEVTSNFAAIANACDIDMVYFDGSERLQGPHGRYNPRLINAFLSKLNRKDILVQASSYSHFSWHQLARSASADGHGDLKGYLEQRAPSFENFRRIGMPLDIGWYYGYDKNATLDMYEYILGTTIGYNSTFSFQVSVAAAHAHPFTWDILDLTRKYDELRCSGRVPPAVAHNLRVAEELLGLAPEQDNRPNHLRRDYRLITTDTGDAFQRVIYGEWQTGSDPDGGTRWQYDLTTGPVQAGVQLHVFPLPEGTPSDANTSHTITNPVFQIGDQTIQWQGTLHPGQYLTLWPNEPPQLRGPEATHTKTPPSVPPTTPIITLPPGPVTIHMKAKSPNPTPYRTRLLLSTQENYPIPR